MATSYTSLLGFALPVTGELDGTWGTTVNDSITELVEDAIAATATASVTSGDWTLTTTGSGATNQARCAIIVPTGTPGTSRNVIAPSQSKAYIVINQSDAAIVFKGSATTGVTISAGDKALVAWNGSDFVRVGVSAGGSNNQVQYNNNGNLAGSANLTFDGTTLTATGNAIVSDNSSNAALRITQTGAGNALLVEDSSNPDSTPFVVAADGRVIVGYTSAITTAPSLTPFVQVNGTGSGSGYGSIKWGNDSSQGYWSFAKSRSATVGTYGTVVQSGDTIGTITWSGDDGTAPIQAANITAAVDGTPGTNDMPGRLIFSTTADGASSPTERMRIGSSGGVSVGSTTTSSTVLFRTAANISTSGVTDYILNYATAQANSFNTGSATGFYSQVGATSTATTADLSQFRALQGTFTLGAAVTNQYGFLADSSLISATNNYGFYSAINSATGRWNFYAAGTAASYFGGDVQFKKAIVEEVYTIADGAAFEVDPSNGTIQLITLGASRTPKATNFAAGESITLMVDDGSAYTITWTDATWGGSGVVWMTGGGTAPTLNTSGYTTIVLWKVSTQVYGAKVG